MARLEMQHSSLRSRVTTAGRRAAGASRPSRSAPADPTPASPPTRMAKPAPVGPVITSTPGDGSRPRREGAAWATGTGGQTCFTTVGEEATRESDPEGRKNQVSNQAEIMILLLSKESRPRGARGAPAHRAVALRSAGRIGLEPRALVRAASLV